MTSSPASPPSARKKHRSGAHLVGAGILLSRLAGLVRERAFAHYFGNSDAGDAFKAALKIPNFLQNLFGEGVLSASFIPVYAGLLARGDEKQAGKVAGVIASLLALATSLLVAAGILLTPVLIDLIAPGFQGEKRLLTIRLVQIFFPGTGLLVMSAWCLGILNSHRRFFLSYAAPVLWNAAIIAALVFYGGRSDQPRLAELTAWGLVAGSALQFGVQLPTALALVRGFSPGISLRLPDVRVVARGFVPVVIARGVVQISAYIDNLLASLLPTGAVSSLAYAQTLYLLPVSLFGMSVSAAELPAMSSAIGTEQEVAGVLRSKLDAGLRQIAYFIVPSAMAFLALGDAIVAALFQSGAFGHKDALAVWAVLAGSTVGLLAATLGRLYSSAFYALKDTRTPLKFAVIRVALTTLLGYVFGMLVPGWVGIDRSWGTAGLTASAGIAGWVEFLCLRASLNRRVGRTGLAARYAARLWGAAALGAALGWAAKLALAHGHRHYHPVIVAAAVLTPFGLGYLAATRALRVPEAMRLTARLERMLT